MAFFTNHEYVGRELKRLKEPMARYVEGRFKELHGEDALPRAREYLAEKRELDRPISEWDVGPLLILVKASWRVAFGHLGEGARSLVYQIADVRNRWAHQEDFSDHEVERTRDLVDQLIRAVYGAPGPRVLRMFEQRLEEARLCSDPPWPEGLSLLWPWLGSYFGALDEGVGFRGVCALDSPPYKPSGESEGLFLYVLPMDRLHRNAPTSLAVESAAEILGRMEYRNSTVFLALREECVSALRELLCRYRAWQDVLGEASEPDDREEARACMDVTRRAIEDQLRIAYCWLLIPTQTGREAPVVWRAICLGASLNPVERAWHELRKEGCVVTHLDAARLAELLDQMPVWQAGPYVKFGDLFLEFARHLHLPRLQSCGVLDEAVAQSFGTPGCQLFEYALYDEYAKVYRPMRPTKGLLKHRHGFLARPRIAV